MEVLMLMSMVPMVLWLGTRQAARIERRHTDLAGRSGRHPVRSTVPLGPPGHARIASVAVVGDELLVQLVAVEGDDGLDAVGAVKADYWLNARPDPAVIEAAEHCCAMHRLIRYCVADSRVVLVEVDGRILPMLRFAQPGQPSST